MSEQRLRLRWDNIAYLVAGVLLVAIAAFLLVIGSGQTTPLSKEPTSTPVRTDDAIGTPTAPTADGDITLEDAQSYAELARQYLQEARWDEASEQLAMIPAALRDASQAAAVEAELVERQQRYVTLRSEFGAALASRSWRRAESTLTELEELAPMDPALLDLRASLAAARTPGAKPKGTDKPAATEGRDTARTPSTPARQQSQQPQRRQPTGDRPSGGHTNTTRHPAPQPPPRGTRPPSGSPNRPAVAPPATQPQLTEEEQLAQALLDELLGGG